VAEAKPVREKLDERPCAGFVERQLLRHGAHEAPRHSGTAAREAGRLGLLVRVQAACSQQEHQRLSDRDLLGLVHRLCDERTALCDLPARAEQLEDLRDRRFVVLERHQTPGLRQQLDALAADGAVQESSERRRHFNATSCGAGG
jgi:hypothetical protein